MLIIGAKGFAKEVLEIVWKNEPTVDIRFYDDVTVDGPTTLFNQFIILPDLGAAKLYFENIDDRFTIAIGRPVLRQRLYERMKAIGGTFVSTISQQALIGSFGVTIAAGCNILAGVQISNDVQIGKGTMVYYHSIITHDVVIGEFCEISPGAILLGRCQIGAFVHIGAGAIILPDVKVGDYAIIGAGAVVRNDVAADVMVAGVPAQVKKKNYE